MSTDLSLQVALIGYEVRASAKLTNLSSQIPLCRCQGYQSPFSDPSRKADGQKQKQNKKYIFVTKMG